ncbi:MAG TPA: bifunctional nuclease domain-containing protein [Candidatus Binataceae bacterium]|nr:bifunctional nuclease domain-containing protein [Candidatus Binataceae bacterium]
MLIAAAACACTRHGPASGSAQYSSSGGEIKVEIAKVGVDRDTGAHFVLLEDRAKDRGLSILVGDGEAAQIMLEMHGLKSPRPLTEDLLRDVLQQTGNHVDKVVISDLRDEVYYAKIFLDGGKHDVDSRPSDAIALAVGTHAPIYVRERLLQPSSELKMGAGERVPKNAHAFGISVQDLTPALAIYFKVEPESAVLVDEVGADAKSAGVERGDLLIGIDGNGVAGVADFDRQIAALKGGVPVILTIKRGSAEKSITVRPDKSQLGN